LYPPSRDFVKYDWDQLTTVAWSEDQDLMCLAHSKGARVVLNAYPGLRDALQNATSRMTWVRATVQKALDLHMDGVNFDWEDPALVDDKLVISYTKLVAETTLAMHTLIPGSQVSVDVPWSPFDVDGRNYDWAGLAAAADILFVMSYDMQSQIFGKCIASANSPPDLVEKGLHQWINLGVPRSKLVLGLPWYGYDYPCQADSAGTPMSPQGEACLLPAVGFRGAPCSDAAGGQINFSAAMEIIHAARNTTPLTWDPVQRCQYFNYRSHEDGLIHQVWLDTPESLKAKYALAVKLGLRGVGMWNLQTLDHNSADPTIRSETQAMWGALDTFTRP